MTAPQAHRAGACPRRFSKGARRSSTPGASGKGIRPVNPFRPSPGDTPPPRCPAGRRGRERGRARESAFLPRSAGTGRTPRGRGGTGRAAFPGTSLWRGSQRAGDRPPPAPWLIPRRGRPAGRAEGCRPAEPGEPEDCSPQIEANRAGRKAPDQGGDGQNRQPARQRNHHSPAPPLRRRSAAPVRPPARAARKAMGSMSVSATLDTSLASRAKQNRNPAHATG